MAKLYQLGNLLLNQFGKQSSSHLFRRMISSSVSIENGILSSVESNSIRCLAFSTTSSDPKAKDETKKANVLKRPLNAFLAFKSDYMQTLKEEGKTIDYRKELPKLASEAWKIMDEKKKLQYTKRYETKMEEYRKAAGPLKPKQVRHAYAQFTAHMYKELSGNGKDFAANAQIISGRWKNLSEKEKLPFQDLHAEDKRRYEEEIDEYQMAIGPVKPKKTTSAYLHFSSSMWKDLSGNGKKFAANQKLISKRWGNLSEQEKKPFQDLHAEDKSRYEEEKQRYDIELEQHKNISIQ